MNAKKRDEQNDAKIPFIRTPYNYDRDHASYMSGLITTEPTLTQQHQKDDTDINVIVQRFGVTGFLPQGARLPSYGDFFAAGDYQTSMNLIIQATDAFNGLPADVRRHFHNDPAALVSFFENDPDPQVIADLGLGHIVSGIRETKPKDDDAGTPA